MNIKLTLSAATLSLLFLAGCSDSDDSTSVSAKAKSALCEKEAVRVMFNRSNIAAQVNCDSNQQATNMAKLEDMNPSYGFLDVYPTSQKIKFDMTDVVSKVDVALLDKDYKVVEIFTLSPDSGVTTSDNKALYAFKVSWGILRDVKAGQTLEVKDLIQ